MIDVAGRAVLRPVLPALVVYCSDRACPVIVAAISDCCQRLLLVVLL